MPVDSPNEPPVEELLEIASSPAPLPEQARDSLQWLASWVPFDAAWLALADSRSQVYTTVGSTGLDGSVLDYLGRPAMAQEIELTGLHRNRPPVSVAELPVAVDELPAWAECLTPAGFREGLAIALFDPAGLHVGFLGLLCSSSRPPSAVMRSRLACVAPWMARGLSPMRSLLGTARIVRGATAGAVLLADGSTRPLPGLEDHALLAADSPVVDLARTSLCEGQVYQSFMWPGDGESPPRGHVRISVLAAGDPPGSVLGAVLLTPDAQCRSLTPRELQVLGLLVGGCSNQQIATRLAVTLRTVAAHVEHVLTKLDAPSRTLAAIRAEREGWYIPQASSSCFAGRH